jgi:hypothetical protein
MKRCERSSAPLAWQSPASRMTQPSASRPQKARKSAVGRPPAAIAPSRSRPACRAERRDGPGSAPSRRRCQGTPSRTRARRRRRASRAAHRSRRSRGGSDPSRPGSQSAARRGRTGPARRGGSGYAGSCAAAAESAAAARATDREDRPAGRRSRASRAPRGRAPPTASARPPGRASVVEGVIPGLPSI